MAAFLDIEPETDAERAHRYLVAIKELRDHLGNLIDCPRCKANMDIAIELPLKLDHTEHTR